jgi:putative hydrolase of the HAD superfamily
MPEPSLPRPDVIFLDLGDTLVRAHPSWADVYRSVFPRFGIEATSADLERVLRTAPWDVEGPFEATEAASFDRVKAFDQTVMSALGYDDLPDEFFRALEEAFGHRSAWHIFPDVVPALDAMREAGIRLGVISNWVWGAPELLHDLELASHFEALIISARVGYQKPDPAIFEHAMELMRVTPDRAIHVGDSFSADVQGARAVGITPVLIDRRVREPGHTHGQAPDGDDVAIIGDLDDLLGLIGIEQAAAVPAS